MDQALVGFVRALRAAGATPSPADTIDAARTLALVGYADRPALKLSLGVVLAKSASEKLLHDRVFEQFFALPSISARHGDDQPAGPPEAQADSGATEAARAGQRWALPGADRPGRTDLDRLLTLAQGAQLASAHRKNPGGGTVSAPHGVSASASAALQLELELALAQAGQAAGVDDIRFESQVRHYTTKLLEALKTGALDERLHVLLLKPADLQTPAEQTELVVLQSARAALQHVARAWVDQRFELFGRGATESFMNQVVVERPLGRMSPPDMARVKAVVARLAQRLAMRYSRRRRVMLRTQLDVRRTVRANAGHDGVPVCLAFKHRRRDKPRITVVCDVSGSVAAHVRFLLLFLYALRGLVTDLHCFAFSDRLKSIDAPLEQLPFDEAMALILKELGHGATDYGQAWADLTQQHAHTIDRQTTLLILGDGRSNHSNPRLDLLAELADRAKRVVWLCPEPPRRWGTGDSVMRLVQPLCTQVRQVANVLDLERVVDDALAAYT